MVSDRREAAGPIDVAIHEELGDAPDEFGPGDF